MADPSCPNVQDPNANSNTLANPSPRADVDGDIGPGLAPPPLPQGCTYTSCYCEENVYLLAQTFASQQTHWDAFAVFVSNRTKTVALWQQKSARGADLAVVWDYHVVLLLRARQNVRTVPHAAASRAADSARGEIPGVRDEARTSDSATSWVYDFDTRLPVPCRFDEYMRGTFPYAPAVPGYELDEAYVRVVPAAAYLDHFVSDRSHMLVPVINPADPRTYSAAPPTYPPLRGRRIGADSAIRTNLMSSYVAMTTSYVGLGETQADSTQDGACYGDVMRLSDFLRSF